MKALFSAVQVSLRPTAKRIIFKKLYGGNLTIYENCAVRMYVKLPDVHPLVKQVMEQPKPDWNYRHPYWEKRRKDARRRLLLTCLILAAVVTLPGCAFFSANEQWEDERLSYAPLPPVLKRVPADKLHSTCGWKPQPLHYLYGCAKRDYTVGLCYIYHSWELTEWQREHEEKHCAGYEHKIENVIRYTKSQ
jgi:hypothetical protein